MTIKEYITSLSAEDRKVIQSLRKIIKETDKSVKEKVGSMMGGANTLVYFADDVFKYSLGVMKNYYSFSSMVMYSTPQDRELALNLFPKAKFQKSCINFTSPEILPASHFKKFMINSAMADFSSIIAYYKSRKK